MTVMDRADALAKKRGYIGIWSMPRELREQIISQARAAPGMAEILERQQRDHTSPFAPVRRLPMSNKPEGVTDETWEIGCSVFADIVNEGGNGDDRETIARAIMAATVAEREGCRKDIRNAILRLPAVDRANGDLCDEAIAAAIRSRTPS